MARLLGEEEFSILFHQGARDSIQLQLIGDRTLLAMMFDERTNLGLVRFYAQETGAAARRDLRRDQPAARGGLEPRKNFSTDASAALDSLF